MHPVSHAVSNQSFAEAIVPAGITTRLHYHQQSEEIYHIIAGAGMMTLGEELFKVVAGDTICIAPGMVHNIKNTEADDLVIFCCCSPAYTHEDTILV